MLKEKIRKFMIGRYGSDDLSLCLLIVAGVCLVFAAISRNRNASYFFVTVLVLLVVLSIYRMLSRNTMAREKENKLYKKITGGFSNNTRPFMDSMKTWWENIRGIKPFNNKKTYGLKACLFKCPGCGVDVKVPANKGKIMITCPKCGREFERIS